MEEKVEIGEEENSYLEEIGIHQPRMQPAAILPQVHHLAAWNPAFICFSIFRHL